MIQMIKTNKKLVPHLSEIIEDEGIYVDISNKIKDDEIVIIKVDDYYKSLKQNHGLKSVDFIVVVDCACNTFAMYLLEFKNIKKPKNLKFGEINEKFKNTIDDFLSIRFENIFDNDKFRYKKIFLYLVSDLYKDRGDHENFEEYIKYRKKIGKKDTLKTEMNLANKLYKFRNHLLRIEFDFPPNPIICKVT
ncbi:MAG: hypothetical protein FWC09_03780 [Lachnospiraceae bacterium]|nr:hypothetical protein [Lachnospiraceae bacterium]